MKTYLSILTSLICVFSLGAQSVRETWPMLGGDPAHTSNAKLNLTFPLVVSDEFAIQYVNEFGTIVSEDKIFFSITGDTNTIQAVDLISGDSLWSFIVPNSIGSIGFVPAVGHGVVLAGGQHSDGLYGLDANSGNVLWFAPIQALYSRSPAIYDSLVYIATFSGLICLDLFTGDILWSHDEPTAQFCPAVDSLNVYFNASNTFGGVIYAKDRLTGEEKWSTASVATGHGSKYILDDNFLYYGFTDTITSFNKFTGEVVWQTSLDTNEIVNYSEMAALTDSFLVVKTVVTGSLFNHYRLINKRDGTIVNSYTHGDFGYSAPTVINNRLVECGYNKISFLDIMTGDSIYAINGLFFGSCPGQIIGVKDKIIIVGQFGEIFILQSAPSGINDFVPDFDVALFPNPASDLVTISLNLAEATTMNMKLITMSGRVMKNESLGFLSIGEHAVPVSLEGLSSGIYLIRLQGETGIVTKKLFVH